MIEKLDSGENRTQYSQKSDADFRSVVYPPTTVISSHSQVQLYIVRFHFAYTQQAHKSNFMTRSIKKDHLESNPAFFAFKA